MKETRKKHLKQNPSINCTLSPNHIIEKDLLVITFIQQTFNERLLLIYTYW